MSTLLAAPLGGGGDAFHVTEVTKSCHVIPKGQQDLKITDSSVTIKRSSGLCNLSFLSSWACVNFELMHTAYLHVTSDQAHIAPLVILAVPVLVITALVYYLSQKVTYIGLVVWFVYFLVWFFFRTSVAVFGAFGTRLDDTWMEISRSCRDQLVSQFLTSYYGVHNLGAPPAQPQDGMQFSSHTHGCCCIPNGEDKLEVFPHHVKIKSTEGMLGHVTGCETLKQKTDIYLMTSKIRWLHFAHSSGSFLWPLVVVWVLVAGCVSADVPPFDSGKGTFYGICAGFSIGPFVAIIYMLCSTKKTLTLALDDTPTGHWAGVFSAWGSKFDFRMPKLQNVDDMKLPLLGTMLGRPVNPILLGRWKGPSSCCAGKIPPRLELYNDHIELFTGKTCTKPGDTYCILLRDIKAIHAGVVMNNMYFYAGMLCLVGIGVCSATDLDPTYSGVLAAIFVIVIVKWLLSKEATVCIGSTPGGAPYALSNPFGDSPFWVTFKTVGNDSVDSIIEQVRHQQSISANNQVGVVLSGHDLTVVEAQAIAPTAPTAPTGGDIYAQDTHAEKGSQLL